MATSQTKPSTPRLSDVARHVVVPKGVVSTGWPAVESKCSEFGVRFRWWQKPIGQIILSKRADGKYAATIGGTGLSIPRQVGKTFLIGAIIFALCLLRPGLTVIWTAHRLRTAEETFGKMQKFAKRKRIAPHILKVVLGSGDEAVEFRNGSRILFGARERGFGRGFDEVDVVVYDEGQILTEAALDDMVPAMNQCRQPEGALMLFMGTPPRPKDPGEVFTRMRAEALSGEDDDTGWVEFGADAEHEFTPLPLPLTEADWKQIAKANPSYPDDTPREAILRMRKKLGGDSFLREGAGIWEKAKVSIHLPDWPARKTSDPAPSDRLTIGIAVDIDLEWSCLGAAAERSDGSVHVSIPEDETGRVDHARGTVWLIPRAKYLQDRYNCDVVMDEKCPDADLADRLREAGVRVTEIKLEQMLEACSGFITAVVEGTLTHFGQPDLDAAVAVAGKRTVTDRPLWARKSGDITPLEGVTIARWGATQSYDVMSSFLPAESYTPGGAR